MATQPEVDPLQPTICLHDAPADMPGHAYANSVNALQICVFALMHVACNYKQSGVDMLCSLCKIRVKQNADALPSPDQPSPVETALLPLPLVPACSVTLLPAQLLALASIHT